MSDNPTRETPDSRSFEERVFARFDTLDARIDRFETRIEGKVDALDGRLTSLEEKVDSRLRETRPIWEAVLARLDVIEKEVKDIGRGVEILHKDVFQTRIKQEELRERVEKLESQSTR
jgi:BMFP domain-containing protein YqiC